MGTFLKSIDLDGYRTIKGMSGFEPGWINVLIGANGAGKSNFVSFFRLLSWMTTGGGNLQQHVGFMGGASKLLFDGVRSTTRITAALNLETPQGLNEYEFKLAHSAGDNFIFVDERYRYSAHGISGPGGPWHELGAGHREAKIVQEAEGGEPTARAILGMLRRCCVYQFHNTSPNARLRQKWQISDSRYLKEDGANLAPFLMRLRTEWPQYYHRILNIIRSTIPHFDDFYLEPESGHVLLQWREKGSDEIFSADQASDGMLRVIALVTLLAQPREQMPDIIILDEPELGLHPYGIETLTGLIRAVGRETQVFVATQSGMFVDYFSPGEIIVVDRDPTGRYSVFHRKSEEELRQWLDDYSMSELWEKNVLGGTP